MVPQFLYSQADNRLPSEFQASAAALWRKSRWAGPWLLGIGCRGAWVLFGFGPFGHQGLRAFQTRKCAEDLQLTTFDSKPGVRVYVAPCSMLHEPSA